MAYENYSFDPSLGQWVEVRPKINQRYWLHILLFLITFLTTTISGTLWLNKNPLEPSNWVHGLPYSIALLVFLSAHEFGHYFAARYHRVQSTLPFYIPIFIPGMLNFGTFGAVIKTLTPIQSRKALFDIGVAGPIAGFIVSLIILVYGFLTLPGIEYIYTIHPEYIHAGGKISNHGLHFGDTLMYWLLAKVFANPNGFLPPMNEIYHYPYLCVGWFGLFVTSLNMLPIGQLDGGHVTYSMFGEKHKRIARIAWWIILAMGAVSLLMSFKDLLPIGNTEGFWGMIGLIYNFTFGWLGNQIPILSNFWIGWLLWAFITKAFIKLDHPPIYDNIKLSPNRQKIGWIALIILMLSFSFNGIYFVE